MRSLHNDPAWRAMFSRIKAKRVADQRAEARRWRGLSDAEKWAEMASAVRRWRRGLKRVERRHVVREFEEV